MALACNMQSSDFSFYAPHCSGCFNTFSGDRPPVKASCAHLFCAVCADPQRSFVCPYDKWTTAAGEFQNCEEIQELFMRLFTEDFDEVLEAVYEEINTTGVLCRCVRAGRPCEDLSRCRYFHGQLIPRQDEDLMVSMEPVFPEDELLNEYIVIEKTDEEDPPSASAQVFEFLFRLLAKLTNTLHSLRPPPDLSSSHYD